MRLSALLAAAVASLPLVVTGGALAPAGALATIALDEAVTDNYKAEFNEDPSVRERRTYLQLHGVSVGGVDYALTTVPATFAYGQTLALTGSDGSSATLSYAVPAERVDSSTLRADSTGTYGPLITVKDPASLAGDPIPVTLTLSTGGTALAQLQVDYRYDATLAGATAQSPGGLAVERNGPGGRWWIGCEPTRTDWEQAAPPSECGSAPDLVVSLQGPARPVPGDTGRFVATVTNTGSGEAGGGGQLTVDLPGVVQLQSVESPVGTPCDGAVGESGPTVTCTVSDLAQDQGVRVVVRAASLAVGPVPVTAAVTTAPGETDSADNDASYSRISRGHTCSQVGTPGPDVMTSPDIEEVVCGLDGDDVLNGSADPDTLLGGDGDDVLRGYGANDLLLGGRGDDRVSGGFGRDTVSYDGSVVRGIVVNLLQRHSWNGPAPAQVPGEPVDSHGYDALSSVEVVRGTTSDDVLVGDGTATTFLGLSGWDDAYGGAGADRLLGGPGWDRLWGQDGPDVLSGGDHTDELRGGKGTDRLLGDGGRDYCDGGGQRGDTRRSCELSRPLVRPIRD